MAFRLATLDDFTQVKAPRLIRSSYKNIAYPLGCSVSELETTLGENEFVLLDGRKQIAGYVRIKSLVQRICYLDIHILGSEKSDKALSNLLIFLRKEYEAGKFYVQIFPFEETELQCLSDLGFTEETRLLEHTFVDGRYRDLVMLGSTDYRV